MKLYIKSCKNPSLFKFLVFDELGEVKYKVSLKHSALTVKLDVFDTLGKRVCKIRKRDIIFLNTYTISCLKEKIKVVFKLTPANPLFFINGLNWFFIGNVLSKNFEMVNVDKSIVFKHKTHWSANLEYYELEINEKDKELCCVCIALCVESLVVKDEKSPQPMLAN